MDAIVDQEAAVGGTAVCKCGAGYMPIENLLVCKEFIAASEDPIIGANQKGKAFKQKMHAMYSTLTDKQAAYDRTMMAQISTGTCSSLVKEGISPRHYDSWSPDLVFDWFKNKISHEVSKFIGVVDTMPEDSGTNDEDHFNDCLVPFDAQYSQEFDYIKCYKYLKDKVKYSSYLLKVEEEEKDKEKSAPTCLKGQKMTKKAI